MKRIYWRPHKVSRLELLLVTVISLGGLVAVQQLKVTEEQPWYAEKVAAARLARRAMEVIREERIKLDGVIDLETDPTQSGLIGKVMSESTTNTGDLAAKQTSVNPNFAAVVVQLLKRCGVEEGDTVAVGPSGSFPALNISAYAAIQALKLRPLIVSSASGSQWGANDPHLMWLDMERILFERRVFGFRSIAASRGGIEDRALGVSKEGRAQIDQAIERNGVVFIRSRDFGEGVEERMDLFREHAGERTIKAYINIGGGTTSVGTRVGKLLFRPGLNRDPPPGIRQVDSVMSRFILDGTPVIHLVKVHELARRYGFPLRPTAMPRIGEGDIFAKQEYNRWLAGGVILVILVLMFAFIRMDLGFRMLRLGKRPGHRAPPEQMV